MTINSKSLYKKHIRVHNNPVSGKFNTIRFFTMFFVIGVFFLLPWFNLNSRQAVWFDIKSNHFYMFGLTFWSQDFILLAILCICLIIALFCVTVYFGRIWCGYLCPQTIWIRIYVFFSRLIDGKRNKRLKLEKQSFDFLNIIKMFFKHFIWLLIAFITSLTFVGYVSPIRELVNNTIYFNLSLWEVFFIIFFIFTTYFNAGWISEQFCFLMCPYARLQTVLYDDTTLVVSYDEQRGEKRGKRRRGFIDMNLGDCIDCKQCVTACPTGIDIRNGLQIECIGCAACIDACNVVMKKVGFNADLIRYARTDDLVSNIKKPFKIRFFFYSLVFILFCFIFAYLLVTRSLFDINVMRNQVELYSFSKDKLIENNYLLKITNKSQNIHNYSVSININNILYTGLNIVTLCGGETSIIPVYLSILENSTKSKFMDVFFKVTCITSSSESFIDKKIQFISSN